MPDHDDLISSGIGLKCPDDHPICDREYGSSHRSSDIDTDVTSIVFFVVEPVASHIGCEVGVPEYGLGF